MKCSELMKKDVEWSNLGEPVDLVAERMRARNVGFLPVCDDEGCVIGAITDRDLTVRVLAEHRDPSATRVGEVMTHAIVASSPDDDIEVAEQRMREGKISRIICIDSDQHPLGVISLSDIAKHDGKVAAEILSSVASRESL